MKNHDFDYELIEIAKNCLYITHPQGLRFYFKKIDNPNFIVAVAGNLVELIDVLKQINSKILKYHLFRVVDEDDSDVPRSDLSLWIHYVLGDIELSAKIYSLRSIDNPETLRKEVLKAVEERYAFFKDILDTVE